MGKKYICTTCGNQYPLAEEEPHTCLICDEERQFINPNGQSWTTLEEMRATNVYKNKFLREEEGLYSISTTPKFAIGQTAYLVQNNGFHVLWDCITYLDEKTFDEIKRIGGVHAIVLSHPHYYSTQIEWAEAFDVPVFIHEDDKEWVVRPSDRIQFWSGNSIELSQGLTIHRLGGHFKGGAVLHWEAGDEGKGMLLTGDIIQVVADNKWVSFMYSYPNLIPLPVKKVAEISNKVSTLRFNRIYNAFHNTVQENARLAVQKSAERYIAALEGRLFET